jgi:hypothetical protein
MSAVTQDNLRESPQYRREPPQYQSQGGDWRPAYQSYPVRRDGSGLARDLVVAGLAVAGIGALAWYYFGPDLRRYIKMSSM